MSSPICTSSPSIAQSSTAPKTRTRAAQKNLKNLRDRWSALIIPSASSSEKPDSHSTDSVQTTTEVATRVLEKEKPKKPWRKWTQDEKNRLQELLDENKTPETILPILESEFSITRTKKALACQIFIAKKSTKKPDSHSIDSIQTTTEVATRVLEKEKPIKLCHKWTQDEIKRLRELLDENKTPETILPILEREFSITLTKNALAWRILRAKKSTNTPIKTHHMWTDKQNERLLGLANEYKSMNTIIQHMINYEFGLTMTVGAIKTQIYAIKNLKKTAITPPHFWTEAQKERLWSLSKEFKSPETVQLMFNREYRLTLSVGAIKTQIYEMKKLKKIAITPLHIWTEAQKERLWSLSLEGNTIKKIQQTLEREFKITFKTDVIKYRLTKLKADRGTLRTPYKKWSQDDLKILKAFLQINSLASQKSSVKKPHHSTKKIFRGINPKEWRKLATTLNRTVPACLVAAYFSRHSQELARPSDSHEEASYLAAAAPVAAAAQESKELEQLNANLKKHSEKASEEFSEDKAVEGEAFDFEAALDYLDNLGDDFLADC